MIKTLEGKSAVVTGAGGTGIGSAAAFALAAEGAKVVVNDIGSDSDGTRSAEKVVHKIEKANGIAIANYDSVATMSGGENIIKTAIDNFGQIDILVNCAGNYKSSMVIDITEQDWDSIIAVHLKGHFSCIKAAILKMIPQKSGRIITFSSPAAFSFGDRPKGKHSLAYSTAKAGILGLTAALSSELKEYNITVNAIVPRAITPLFPDKRPKFGGGQTEGPDSVAPIIVYLSSDEAKNITGQFIYICGGDFCIYNHPLQLDDSQTLVRTPGKWTVHELNQIFPPLSKNS